MNDDDDLLGFTLGSIADFDQHHAEAIDLLRKAETFFLAVPGETEEGEPGIIATGGGLNFDSFKLAVAAGLNVDTWQQIERFLKRDAWLRRAMIAAACANIAFFIVNVGLALPDSIAAGAAVGALIGVVLARLLVYPYLKRKHSRGEPGPDDADEV